MEPDFDINRIRQKAENAKKDFWSNDRLPYGDKKLLSYYNQNEKNWILNAFELRKTDPVKTNIFLANIYRSNFTFKLIGDRLNFFEKKKRYSIHDKIGLIKSAFESSYYHFAFISICANYDRNFYETLYTNWHQPEKAKEFIKNKNEKQWIINNVPVSGKKWVLENCPLFKFSPISIELLGLIKNADSHQKLIITNNSIVILNDKKQSISIKDFNKLFQYVRNTIFLAIGFNLMLAIKFNFWITPALILTNSQKFNYTRVTLPDIETIEKKSKEQEEIKYK